MTFRISAGLSLLLFTMAGCIDCNVFIPKGDGTNYTPVDLPIRNEIVALYGKTPEERDRATRELVLGLPTEAGLRNLEDAGFKCVASTCFWMHASGAPRREVTRLNTSLRVVTLDESSSLTDAEIHTLADSVVFMKGNPDG